MRTKFVFALSAAVSTALWGQSRPPATNPLQTLPRIEAPAPPPSVTLNVQPQQQSPLQALLATTLTPSQVHITGVHAVPFDEVAALFKPLTGKTVRIADLVAASEACTRLYQQRGYVLSFCFIPAQTFADGVVDVVAVEGYVAGVDIGGDAGTLEHKIRAIAAHVEADRPLRKSTFERYVQTLGMLPGAQISANVPAPATTNGATRLQLTVKRKRYDAGSGINFNQPGVQGVLNGSLNALTPLGEQLTASMLYPKGRGDQSFYTAGYGQMLGSRGLMLKLDASRYRGNPDIDNQLPDYLRHRLDQDRVALSLSYPLLLSTTRSLVLGGGVYGSDQHDSYFNRINGARLVLQTDVRVLHSELDYTQASATQVRKLGLGIGQGFDAWGAQSRALTNIAGASLASPSDVRFTRYNLNASQSDSWGAHVGTVLSLVGQYSRDHLPSTEQISFGGPRYGLAYDPGSISGDSGWGAALEVNRPFAYGATWLKALVPYAVAQQARVYLNGARPQLDTLQSMALGLRLSDNRHYTVDVSAAQPLGELPANQRRREPRYGLSFSYQLR